MNREDVLQLIEELFQFWYPSLLRYTTRLSGSLELAEDVVQEAFLLMCRDLLLDKVIENPRGWTLQVVRRLVKRGLHWDEARTVSIESLSEAELPHSETAMAERAAEIDEVISLFSILAPREEEVILLRIEGLKYREIGEVLGIRPQTVHVLLSRGLAKLQRKTQVPQRRQSDVAKTP